MRAWIPGADLIHDQGAGRRLIHEAVQIQASAA
jgi:hypothetical protein